jgi:glycosyltransferase involved in cell wall biosynthesis
VFWAVSGATASDVRWQLVNRKMEELAKSYAAETSEQTDTTSDREKYLLLASDETLQGLYSGYSRLSSHIAGSQLIHEIRNDPRKLGERALVKLLDTFSGSSWYRLASLKLEYRAWRVMQAGFTGLVHLMWAERDWGFLDQLPISRRNATLCGTFHTPPDTLPKVVTAPERLKNFAALILMSEVQRPFFESLGVSSDRIHVVHHGVDCNFFSPSRTHRSEVFTVLFVGNFRRNFGLLAKICRLLEPYEDITIKLVVPKSRIAEFEGHKNVIVESNLSDVELRNAYREASCLLMTLEAATANNAILEAMACGLPIVAENIGGVAEYTGIHSAILCQPGSAGELTDAILTLYRDQSMCARMGEIARARATELDWPIVAKRTIAVYEETLGKRHHF